MKPQTVVESDLAGLRLLSMKEVCELTGYSRTHIYRLERVGRFPRRRKIGLARIGFLRSEYELWLRNLPIPALPSELAS